MANESIGGKVANIHRASTSCQVFIAYKRIPSLISDAERYHLVYTLADICVLNISKKQMQPLGFTLLDKSTTAGNWAGSTMKLAFRKQNQLECLIQLFHVLLLIAFQNMTN